MIPHSNQDIPPCSRANEMPATSDGSATLTESSHKPENSTAIIAPSHLTLIPLIGYGYGSVVNQRCTELYVRSKILRLP